MLALQKMLLIVTGFGPFQGCSANPTARLIELLDEYKELGHDREAGSGALLAAHALRRSVPAKPLPHLCLALYITPIPLTKAL